MGGGSSNDQKSALVKSNKMCLTRSQKVFVEVIMILMVLFILLHVFKNYKQGNLHIPV